MTKKEKFDNVCFTVYSEIRSLELYIELVREFEINGNSNSELIKTIKDSFGFQIASIFSRIVEDSKRNSANIFYIKRFINSEINNLSKNENEKNILRQAKSDIGSFIEKYKIDIEVFRGIKNVKISHNDLILAKLNQEKILKYDLVRMTEIKNYLINIFKKISRKGNFKQEDLNEIKNEVSLFCRKKPSETFLENK
ncbi:hypothetical protein KKB43_01675 [Patescibacteria group bacterium]|nr:hypothetical protein [Patescibacteria group bacterium]MBU4579703.1 hypothetical protein [Patescibacteria group bacterium]